MTPEEIGGEYEAETGNVIVETFKDKVFLGNIFVHVAPRIETNVVECKRNGEFGQCGGGIYSTQIYRCTNIYFICLIWI